jgi:hypothetical protein
MKALTSEPVPLAAARKARGGSTEQNRRRMRKVVTAAVFWMDPIEQTQLNSVETPEERRLL